ncbi:CopD family protein [uncultured Erythrobacter sp.]|uniref:CopD family protein n=1 Tax=uncultured Erythrobacter sp. TaxID=263913 RepID=UPI002605D0EB|nr:CopD family protein [uncultured Erythrobacter sp.]
MRDVLMTIYPWLTAGHVIFMVFWLAGLFMLPRQCIYILDAAPGSEEEAKWSHRMGLLRKIILSPSMIVVWVLGLTQAVAMDMFSQGWLHIKITLVVILTAYHGWLVGQTKRMARGERPLDEKTLRLVGEIPGILLILIIVTLYVGRLYLV